MNISIVFIIQIVFSLLICFIAAVSDFKKGIISNKLNLFFSYFWTFYKFTFKFFIN